MQVLCIFSDLNFRAWLSDGIYQGSSPKQKYFFKLIVAGIIRKDRAGRKHELNHNNLLNIPGRHHIRILLGAIFRGNDSSQLIRYVDENTRLSVNKKLQKQITMAQQPTASAASTEKSRAPA